MSLEAMIRRHDDTALEALTNKGTLRRAHRDLDAGQARTVSLEAEQAIIAVAEQSVTLNAKGPDASACDCKTHGICRHIVVAMLYLRSEFDTAGRQSETGTDPNAAASGGRADEFTPDTAQTPDRAETQQETAAQQLCALSDAQLLKFAGADWGKALLLAQEQEHSGDDSPQWTIEDQGINATVRLDDLGASVTFIVDNGLKGAAYKGPKTRKRLLTTAAALVIRQRGGLKVEENIAAAAKPAETLSERFLDEAQQAIEQALAATLASRSILARDLLLDLAISSRCEALPRLSAELRGLAKQARLANEHNIEFEPETFLMAASRSYALLETLCNQPPDVVLGGMVRRQYETTAAIEAWPLGVSRWRSDAGARGLTAHVFDSSNNRWLSTLTGRSAGADLGYDISTAYESAVWGTGTFRSLTGKRIQLPEPKITADGSLSPNDQTGSRCRPEALTLEALLPSSLAHSNWVALREDLAQRMGQGLRRRAVPLPAIIVPRNLGDLHFDEMAQRYEWPAIDDSGRVLPLRIDSEEEWTALQLWKLGSQIKAILVETRLEQGELTFRPVSIMLSDRSELRVYNIDFDTLPIEQRSLKATFAKLGKRLIKPAVKNTATRLNPVQRLLLETTEALVSAVSTPSMSHPLGLIRKLEACGLVTLASQLTQAAETRATRDILVAAYTISELHAIQVCQ